MPRMTADGPVQRPLRGVEDGGHVLLSCSSCNRKLVDVFVTNPHAKHPLTGEPFCWSLRATCCFCGDKSFPVEVKGLFHKGGWGEIKRDDVTEDVPQTKISHEEIAEDGVSVTFFTIKA